MQPSAFEITEVLQSIRLHVRWKPGSAERHLRKRIARQHLPSDATVDSYEAVIHAVLDDQFAKIYIYQPGDVPYLCVISVVEHRHWLVMSDMAGVLETAFPMGSPANYLNKPEFILMGLALNYQ